jgi:hypothetical protein
MSLADTDESPDTQPVAWIVSHAYQNYFLHEGLIGNRILKESRGSLGSETPIFKNIKEGNIIAYYDYKAGCLLGLFTVCEKEASVGIFENTVKDGDNWFLKGDKNWDPALVHYIKPYCKLRDKWIDLRKYINDHKSEFSKEFLKYMSKVQNPKSEKADLKIQKKVCLQLNFSDYGVIKNLLEDSSKSTYWVETPDVLFSNAEEVTSLLDFYNNRSTSFANLFVASIFGIVTLSAMVVSVINDDFWRAIFSMAPFGFFVAAGAYTLIRYSFYASTAEEIKRQGFLYENLKTKNLIESERCFRNAGLAGYFERENHSKFTNFFKKFRTRLPFTLIYAFAIATLFLFVYWDLFFAL